MYTKRNSIDVINSNFYKPQEKASFLNRFFKTIEQSEQATPKMMPNYLNYANIKQASPTLKPQNLKEKLNGLNFINKYIQKSKNKDIQSNFYTNQNSRFIQYSQNMYPNNFYYKPNYRAPNLNPSFGYSNNNGYAFRYINGSPSKSYMNRIKIVETEIPLDILANYASKNINETITLRNNKETQEIKNKLLINHDQALKSAHALRNDVDSNLLANQKQEKKYNKSRLEDDEPKTISPLEQETRFQSMRKENSTELNIYENRKLFFGKNPRLPPPFSAKKKSKEDNRSLKEQTKKHHNFKDLKTVGFKIYTKQNNGDESKPIKNFNEKFPNSITSLSNKDRVVHFAKKKSLKVSKSPLVVKCNCENFAQFSKTMSDNKRHFDTDILIEPYLQKVVQLKQRA